MLVCYREGRFTGFFLSLSALGAKQGFLLLFSAESLAEVFSWLGFRVLMCKDQTKDQMDRALKCFASQSDVSQLQEFDVKEWSDNRFTDLQEAPKHGDAFICCILSHRKEV